MNRNPFEALPLISAGFRSPAEDFLKDRLDFNAYLRRTKPSAITEYRVNGKCMEGAFVPHGSIVVIDASIRPPNGSLVAALVEGEEMIKQLVSTQDGDFLVSAPIRGKRESVKLEKEMNYKVWGTVTHAVIDLYYPVNFRP